MIQVNFMQPFESKLKYRQGVMTEIHKEVNHTLGQKKVNEMLIYRMMSVWTRKEK